MLALLIDTDQHGMYLAHFVEQPNARPEPRPMAGTTQERKLLGVGSRPLLGRTVR